jgi:hypothetical protein
MNTAESSFVVDLDFEAINLPPVTDILVLGRKLPQGKFGVLHSFQLISPDVFEMIETNDDPNVEAIIINKGILKKISRNQVLKILSASVFPYVAKGESVRVNFNIHIFHRNIKGDTNDCEILPSN